MSDRKRQRLSGSAAAAASDTTTERAAAAPVAVAGLCDKIPNLRSMLKRAGLCNHVVPELLPEHIEVYDLKGKPPEDMGPGFNPVAVFAITNHQLATRFHGKATEVAHSRPDFGSNTKIGFHVTKGDLDKILREGLDPRISTIGFFGKGAYVARTPMKANDFCVDKGNPQALRVMLRCQVILGRSKEFEIGQFARNLVTEPEGFDSVTGFIRRAHEYVVYRSEQCLITHVILYRFTDTAQELTPSLAVPPNVNGRVVYITAALSEFFSELQKRSNPSELPITKRLILQLLQSQITVDAFLSCTSQNLKAPTPPDLRDKLLAELAKCKIPLASHAVPIGAASAPVEKPGTLSHTMGAATAPTSVTDLPRTESVDGAASALVSMADIQPSRPGETANNAINIQSDENDDDDDDEEDDDN